MQRLFAILILLLAACTSSNTASPSTTRSTTQSTTPNSQHPGRGNPSAGVPHFAHIVVVIEENHSYRDVVGSGQAPYFTALARSGALLTNSYGVAHPSEPNYLALFSGSTHGLTDDSCPLRYHADNLAAQLRSRGMSFVGYAESLPAPGYRGCAAGGYARKHAPWTDFADVPARVGQPMSAFPTDFGQLPRVAFVVPNLDHDMHDGTVGQADQWLRAHLGGYASWARDHDSLLIVTWDEDDFSAANHIPGLLVGAHVRRMRYRGRVDHYTVLRTIEAAERLPTVGATAYRTPITAVWMP
ncbi:MAG TPA: alkaline phosphatase family protein [Jatrophihabitans sp.]|nr:alkaline phosphatase family protein [Jatrophihabitans sp.]